VSGPRSTPGSARGTKARAARTGQTAKAGTKSPKTGVKSAKSARATSTATPTSTTVVVDDDRLAGLVEERDFLLGSLRDLEAEHEVGDVDDADYEALKDDYTARAAAAIRAVDGQQKRATKTEPSTSWTRRILVMAAVAVFAVGAGVLVAQWSGDRGAGDTITGGIRGNTRDELLEARQDGAQQKYLEAVKVYDQVLAQDPANTEALAYKGWMLRLVSIQASGQQKTQLQAEAKASLEQALRTEAKDPTSLVFMAVLLGDLGQPQPALADLDQVPPGQLPSFMSSTIDQLRSQLEAQVNPSSTTSTTAP
jgi:hypothetical protein